MKVSASSKPRLPPSQGARTRRFLTDRYPPERHITFGNVRSPLRFRITRSSIMKKTVANSPTAAVELKDARLFREACYVDGQWVQAHSTEMINVDNPATSEVIGRVPRLIGAETREAIEAANRAFPAWSKKTAKERAEERRGGKECRSRWSPYH